MSGFERFLKIRKLYSALLPKWMEEYRTNGNMRHDPYTHEMLTEFTPIEESVWIDIRSTGCPFYPQVPALNYFLDFSNPFLKIAIECDGREWHNKEKDAIRDQRLLVDGWRVFRIQGHECNRLIVAPWDQDTYEKEIDEDLVIDWFMLTSEGVIYSINQAYFSNNPSEKYSDLIRRTLAAHRSLQV